MMQNIYVYIYMDNDIYEYIWIIYIYSIVVQKLHMYTLYGHMKQKLSLNKAP